MTNEQIVELLHRTKTIWPKLHIDDFVRAEWNDALGRLEYGDVFQALTELRDVFEGDPPVIGQIRRAAMQVWTRRVADERAQRRALEDKSRDPELVSIKEMVDAFFARQNTTREAVFKRLGWDKIGGGGRGGPRSDGGG